MTFEEFRQRYGAAFYAFINSELGQAWLTVMEKNDPTTRLIKVEAAVQSQNSTLFLGQITGWRDAIAAQGELIVQPNRPGEILESYADDGEIPETGMGEGGSLPAPPPPPTPIRKRSSPKKPQRKRK